MGTENLELYNSFRAVPEGAKKTISGGRLNGMTDINPMWRVKALTEKFGPAGIGWWYTIERQWIEPCADGEQAAFCDILLYYKHNGTTSTGIPGTGGSMLVARERNGLRSNDECYKMALTDAISVAAKALGVGADVYWSGDNTKYTKGEPGQGAARKPGEVIPDKGDPPVQCEVCGKLVADYWDGEHIIKASERGARSRAMFGRTLCGACGKVAKKAGGA